MKFNFDLINYNKLKYLDIINFYKLCFINQSEIIINKSLKLFIIEGKFNNKYVSNWLKKDKFHFKLYYKYRKDEILAAMDYFSSLDFDSASNRKWYFPHSNKIKKSLLNILGWFWLGERDNYKRWNIFTTRFYTLFIRSFYLLRKY